MGFTCSLHDDLPIFLVCKPTKQLGSDLSYPTRLTSDLHTRHNSSHWEVVPYSGIGAAAHSFGGLSRQWNPESLNEYFRGIESGAPTFEREILTKNQCYDEMVMTGLRTAKGVDLRKLENMFGKDALDYCMSNAQPHIEAGRMMIEGNRILKLSKAGIFTSDDIMSDLMMATE
jgi:oxygen-independent coproporphyrinogen-3 oxidase